MEETLCNLVAEMLNWDTNNLTLETKIADVEQWDSLAHVSILMAIEDKLNIEIDTDEFLKAQTINDILNLINDRAS